MIKSIIRKNIIICVVNIMIKNNIVYVINIIIIIINSINIIIYFYKNKKLTYDEARPPNQRKQCR
jgi:cell division protein FtsL